MSLINKDNQFKGIDSQITSKDSYKELTKEKIEEVLKDIMFSTQTKEDGTKKPPMFRELPEGFDLDFQIQDGYIYQMGGGEGEMTLMTGCGGIRSYIEQCRKLKMNDFFIAQDIYVGDYSKGSSGRMYWIGDVKWKKIGQE